MAVSLNIASSLLTLRLDLVSTASGVVVIYRYGDHGLPISLESSVYGKIVSNTTCNELGKLFDLSLGNGLTTSYRYWDLDYGGNAHYGLIYSIATGSHQNLTYSDYDAVGNIKQLIDGRTGETISLGYDHLDRLTSASSGLFSERYGYNSVGNFLYKGSANNTYSYPNAGQAHPHAPNSVTVYLNTYGCEYDANGNLTRLATSPDRTCVYDEENRLKQVLQGGSQVRAFTYDGDGVLRTVAGSGAATTRYVTPDYRVDIASGEATVYYRFGGRAVAWRNNSGMRYVLADHLSSSHGEASSSQGELGQRRMYPYGGSRFSTGDLKTDRLFTGQIQVDNGGNNPRSELYNYGARWYLPGVGIFTQPDIIVPDYRNPQALNRYAYTFNNPLKYNDPSGHAPLKADPLTVTPVPLPPPTPGPTPTPMPSQVGPVPAQVTPIPAPAPTPSSPSNAQAASSPAPFDSSGPSLGAVFSRALIDAYGSPVMNILPMPLGRGQVINTGLGIALGELGGGQRRIGPGGNLVYENVQGITREIVRERLGGGAENAVTIGNVILNSAVFDQSTESGARWMAHEHAHVGQSGALGPLYLPMYGLLYLLSGPVHDEHPMEYLANQYRDAFWQDHQIQPSGQTP